MWRRFKKNMTTPLGRGGDADRVLDGIIMLLGPFVMAMEVHEQREFGWHVPDLCSALSLLLLGFWSLKLWAGLLRRVYRRFTQPRVHAWPPAVCPRCLYDLRASTSVACPECGYYLGTTKRGRTTQ